MSRLFDILRARAARGSRAPHGDAASVALVVEGGAMRGVVSAGMVSALEQLGLTDAFDAVYGASAGAMNAAYFLAGQARLGTTIYFEDINTRAFIDPWRPLRGRPTVDVDFVTGRVALEIKALDTARVLASPSPLTVLATDAGTAKPAAFRAFETGADLLRALRAGSTMPVVAGGPFPYRGGHYFDASLSEPIPVPTAETGAHTHILVLLTRPDDASRKASLFDRFYVTPRLHLMSPRLARSYRHRMVPYAALLERIHSGMAANGRTEILGVRPASPTVRRLERDRALLEAGAARGFDALMTAYTSGITG